MNSNSDEWNQIIEDALQTIINGSSINPTQLERSNGDISSILLNNTDSSLNTLDISRNPFSQTNPYSTIGSSLGSRLGSSLANTASTYFSNAIRNSNISNNTNGTDEPMSYTRPATRASASTNTTTSVPSSTGSSSHIHNRDTYRTRPSTSNNGNITTDPSPEETATEQPNDYPDNSNDNTNHLHERFGSFIMGWMDCMNRYNNNMRQYHHNINQFNRVSTTILNMMSSYETYQSQPTSLYSSNPQFGYGTGTTTSPNLFDFELDLNSRRFMNSIPPSLQEIMARNPTQVEIQGFSIPLSGSSEDRPSFPTISQVFNATEIFTYNDETASRVTDTRCPISLEDFEQGEELCEIRHCHHVFKWTSLQRWFSQNSHCPVCRHNIV